jgi:hypothetical protein
MTQKTNVQSRSTLRRLVMAPNSGLCLAPGLTSSQAGDHITPISCCSDFRLRTLVIKVKVTLRLAVNHSLCLGSSPFCFSVCYCLWGALSDERSGLSFVCQSLQYLLIC